MRSKLTYTVAIVLLAFMNFVPAQGQDDFGYQIYDSIRVDLFNGAITDKYLPFDVPFKLIGNADGLSSVRLSIIESDEQACCDVFTLDPTDNRDKNPKNCECPCLSVTEKRLAFYRNVRRIENEQSIKNKLSQLNRDLNKINYDLIQLKNQLNQLNPGNRSIRIDSISIKMLTEPKNTTTYNKTKYQWVLENNINVKKSDSIQLKQEIQFLQSIYLQEKDDSIFFSTDGIRFELAFINQIIKSYWNKDTLNKSYNIEYSSTDSLKSDTVIFDNLLKFNEPNFEKYSKAYDAILIKKIKLERQLSTLKTDSLFYQKHKSSWTAYTDEMKNIIRKDSMRLCPKCDFNPYRCNIQCEWNIDTLGSKQFHLLIPPLESNKSYTFYFDITRSINDNEQARLKYVMSAGILKVIDQDLLRAFDVYYDAGMNLAFIRQKFITGNISERHMTFIRESVEKYLESAHFQSVSSSGDRISFDDSLAVKNLINEVISHKYYKTQLDKLLKQYDTSSTFSSLQSSILFINGTYENFYAANRMDDYYLLDTLKLITDAKPFKPITLEDPQIHVPAGLMKYANLQKVSLRNLQNIDDFDPETVDQYLYNLGTYSNYLKKVHQFVNETLIRGSRDLRLSLFKNAGYSGNPNIPEQIKKAENTEILEKLHDFSKDLYHHIQNVEGSKRIYESFKENLININYQINHLLDSALNDNQKVQLSTTRQAGGTVAANFQTRTKWLITADVGMAYSSLGDNPGQLFPYAGANFNLAPINRQAHYSLFQKGLFSKNVVGDCKPGVFQRATKFLVHLQKASSIVVGVTLANPTTSNANLEGALSINNTELGLMLGYGLRLTDAIRFGTGAILLREDQNPFVEGDRINPFGYFSLSIDFDVANTLGLVGEFFFPNRLGGGSDE